MTKAELIAALMASKAKGSDDVYVYDYGNGTRHDLQSVDFVGVLDLNCNNDNFDAEEEDNAIVTEQQAEAADAEIMGHFDISDEAWDITPDSVREILRKQYSDVQDVTNLGE